MESDRLPRPIEKLVEVHGPLAMYAHVFEKPSNELSQGLEQAKQNALNKVLFIIFFCEYLHVYLFL